MDINPFYTRASEYVGMDDKFLNLFCPDILNIFQHNQNEFHLWSKVNVLRSSPGGGKTTLLKLFTPQVLKKLKETSDHGEHSRDILNFLKKLDAYDNKGHINVIGSLISFNSEYASIEFLPEHQKKRVFFSLVNIRVILSTLQSISFLRDFESDEDYKRISVNLSDKTLLPINIRNVTNGLELYHWACDQEEYICNRIDSVHLDKNISIEGTDALYSLDLLAPKNLVIDGQPLKEKVLVMFDDLNNLSSSQRAHLVTTIIQKRPLVNTWIAERLKALTMDELFSEGHTQDRDMNIIYIERFWSKKHVAFEKFAKSIASRRIAIALDTPREFASYLSEDLGSDDSKIVQSALEKIRTRIIQEYGVDERYKSWILTKEELQLESYQLLIEWRSLEILLYRDKNKPQKQLFEDEEGLDEDELSEQDGSDVKMAAQLFLNQEFGLPFYYGISKICRLASFNIEQFLSIAGYFYEEIRSNTIKKIVNSGYKLEIIPRRQEQIVKHVVENIKWKELTNKVPNFSKIQIFLDSIGAFCANETYLPNAWNSPGLNGIAIMMTDHATLKNKALKDKSHIFYELAKCIADCIVYNLLEVELNYKCKGRYLMVIYLNKMYCAKYNLPMNRGKFKEKKLSELIQWYNNKYKPQVTNKLPL